MLAEKFILYLEALIKSQSHADGSSQTYPDGSPRVISTPPQAPVKPPVRK